jgi:hypothetical protein
VSANAAATDRLRFSHFSFNVSGGNTTPVAITSSVSGGSISFEDGAFESYTADAVLDQSAGANVVLSGCTFAGTGTSLYNVASLTSAATGLKVLERSRILQASPALALPASQPPRLSLSNNPGFQTAGVLTITTDGTTSSFAANHGLLVPSGANLPLLGWATPNSASSAPPPAFTVAVTSTQLQIVFAAAPAAGATYVLHWRAQVGRG